MDTLDKAKDNLNVIELFIKKIKDSFPNIILAIVIFFAGLIIAKIVKNAMKKFMNKSKTDVTVIGFLSQVLFFSIIVIFTIMSLGALGMPTNSFVAALGGFGIAVGLALQNNLSNFASGIIILIFKPFKVGDFIETKDGVSGTVYSIRMMNTSLDATDNKRIYIPNSNLTSAYVMNYSQNQFRNAIINIKIGYEEDHEKAIKIIRSLIKENDMIINKENSVCEISELSVYFVNIFIKFSIETKDYWTVYYKFMKQIKEEFQTNDLEFVNFKNPVSLQKL